MRNVRNLYDQSINDFIKQNDKVRKVSTRQGDGYSTECLRDYAYFKNNRKLTEVDLNKKNL